MTILSYKCPCCGYIKGTKNPSKLIADLRRKRSKSTKSIMRKVSNRIATSIPSENIIMKEYFFYQGVSKVKDEIVRWGIERYLESKAYYKGKGYKYLTHIILNNNTNRDKMKRYERQMIGKPPSVIEMEDE